MISENLKERGSKDEKIRGEKFTGKSS